MKHNPFIFHLSVQFFLLLITSSYSELSANELKPALQNANEWQLVWSDEFDYSNDYLERIWESQNGPSGHILCSRWRENVEVKNGMLRLINKKESRGGQEWTSGNIWTK